MATAGSLQQFLHSSTEGRTTSINVHVGKWVTLWCSRKSIHWYSDATCTITFTVDVQHWQDISLIYSLHNDITLTVFEAHNDTLSHPQAFTVSSASILAVHWVRKTTIDDETRCASGACTPICDKHTHSVSPVAHLLNRSRVNNCLKIISHLHEGVSMTTIFILQERF